MAFPVAWTKRALKELRYIDPRHRRVIASWVNERERPIKGLLGGQVPRD